MPNKKCKQTSVGKIPEEWEVVQIGSITKEHKQGFYTDENYSDDGINLVRITDLQNPGISYLSMPKIKIDENTFKQFKVKVGDFLIARSGAIGRYGIVESSIPCVFASYIIRFRFDNSRVDNSYFGKLFESFYISNELRKITQGATNKNINAQNIKKIKIPLPPLPEQRRIAEVLGTVDSAIQKVGGAIESTERLKKGLMQRLLTRGIGHERFKFSKELGCEIPEGWEVVMMGDVADDFVGGGTPSTSNPNYWNGKIAWMTSAHISGKVVTFGQRYITEKGLNESSTHLIPNGNLLVATRVGIGKVAINSIDVAISQDLTGVLIKKDKASVDYVYWFILNNPNKLKSLAQGSTIKGLLKDDLANFKLPLPSLPEQRRIAEILGAADRKLELERRRREKLERVKKGLMNELLTGRKRVKIIG